MSEDEQREKYPQDDKKKTRRTRKDQEGRNFTCPCGKSYLSYPALYTHIKTKHQGKTPKQQSQGAVAIKPQNIQDIEPKNSLPLLKDLLQKFFNSDGQPTSALSDSDCEYVKMIMQGWESIKHEKEKQEDLSNNQNQTINNILGRFLIQMKAQTKPQIFMYLCEFVCCFYKVIIEEKKDENYCQKISGNQLPYLFNSMILKKKVPEIHPRDETVINNLALACKVLFYFGLWLLDQKYTNSSVRFNVVDMTK